MGLQLHNIVPNNRAVACRKHLATDNNLNYSYRDDQSRLPSIFKIAKLEIELSSFTSQRSSLLRSSKLRPLSPCLHFSWHPQQPDMHEERRHNLLCLHAHLHKVS